VRCDDLHGKIGCVDCNSRYTIADYRNAPSGIGPLANEWKDKPHRLVYDLCRLLEKLT
jgi:hypothetical protein